MVPGRDRDSESGLGHPWLEEIKCGEYQVRWRGSGSFVKRETNHRSREFSETQVGIVTSDLACG